MPQTVEIPDHGIAEFPDDMTPDQIKGVIQSKFYTSPTPQATATPQAETTPSDSGFSFLPKSGAQIDVGEARQVAEIPALKNAVEGAAETAASFVPHNLEQAAQLATSLTPVGPAVQSYRAARSIAEGRPLEALSGIPVAQRIPEIIQAGQTEPLSKERFKAGFGTLADLLMVGGIGAMARGGAAPVSEIQPPITSPPSTLNYLLTGKSETPPLVEAVNENLADLEKRYGTQTQGEPNAIQPSNAQVETGQTAQRVETGAEGAVSRPSDSDYAIREAQGAAESGQIPARQGTEAQPAQEEVAASTIKDLVDRYDAGDEKIQTVRDLVDEVDAQHGDNPEVAKAVERYRADQEENMQEFGGRGDEDQIESEFLSAIQKVSEKPAPVPTTEAATTAANLPQKEVGGIREPVAQTGAVGNKMTVFRGEPKSGSGKGLSAHGTGTYYGLDEASAQRFSKSGTVSESKVTLENPLTVNSDAELRAIRTEAGVNSDPRALLSKTEAAKFTQHLESKGHDSFVTNYNEAPGGKQIVVFRETPSVSEVKSGATDSSIPKTEEVSAPKEEAPTAPLPTEPISEDASGGEPRTTGIAQRITGVPAGLSISAEESVTRGRKLINDGADPQAIADRIKTTKQVSSDDLSVLRAREEQLSKAAYMAGDNLQANPTDPVAKAEYEAALKARNDWRRDQVKPAQTEWSNIGKAQQGETDIDTGTFTGLRMAFADAKGREPTPVEQTRLRKIVDQSQEVSSKIDEAKSKYDAVVEKATGGIGSPSALELQTQFGDRLGVANAKLSQQEIASLWKYAKDNYIDQGVSSLDDTIHGVAIDTGLDPKVVAEAFTKPKAIRQITNDLYKQMANRRDMVNAAKDYINSIDSPMWKRVAKAVWETPFSIAIYGHGTVGGITHAGANIFKPTAWKVYWPEFVNQAKFFARRDIHEAAMQRLVRDSDTNFFTTAKRAGLANDPNLTYTDYGAYAKFFGLQAGRRGFDALKTMRQGMFNDLWKSVPESVKSNPIEAKELAQGYADMINHATGVIASRERGFLGSAARAGSPVMFAAKLEASRWARVIGDPIKTLDIYARWNQATNAEKAVALRRTRNAAEFAGVFLGSLYLNQAILSASGSKEKINFTDPGKSDWLKHKIAGHAVAVDGGLLSPIRLLGRLVYDSMIRPRKELRGDTRTSAALKDVGQYAVGKAAPSVAIVKEAATAESFDGRLLPWSRDTSKKPKMTWTEYAASHGPIPASEGIKEVYDSLRERGMNDVDASAFIRGLGAFGAGLTGARVTVAPEERPQTPKTIGTQRRR